jgi:hypothetical protein
MRTVSVIFLLCCFALLPSRREKQITYAVTVEKKAPGPVVDLPAINELLQEGDIVMRLHLDPGSYLIQQFNRTDKRYSHAGIVLMKNNEPFICHIINGPDNPGEKIRLDPLIYFADPQKIECFGIYRYDLSSREIKRIHAILNLYIQKNVRFDSLFDFKTDNRMYCTELISKVIRTATQNRIRLPLIRPTETEASYIASYTGRSPGFIRRLKLVAPDALYLHPACRLIRQFDYNRK